jgi:hypothetical protein
VDNGRLGCFIEHRWQVLTIAMCDTEMFVPKRGRVAFESAAFDVFCKQGIGRNPWPEKALGMQASQMVHTAYGDHFVDLRRLAWIQKEAFGLQNQILDLVVAELHEAFFVSSEKASTEPDEVVSGFEHHLAPLAIASFNLGDSWFRGKCHEELIKFQRLKGECDPTKRI